MTTPKCLVPIAREPLLGRWIDALDAAGVDRILVTNSIPTTQFKRYLEHSQGRTRAALDCLQEEAPAGTATSMRQHSDRWQGARHVIIVYPDAYSDIDLGAMLVKHARRSLPVTLAIHETDDPHRCGIVELDGDRVVGFEEKPARPRTRLAFSGVLVVDGDHAHTLVAAPSVDIARDCIPRFIGRAGVHRIDGVHLDIGVPAALAAVQRIAAARSDTPRRPAAFFDRDGTLVRSVHRRGAPEALELLEGVADSVERLRAAGFAAVVVTNQGALGMGLLKVPQLQRIHWALWDMLAERGAQLDAVYHCPEPHRSASRLAIDHPDRKPGPGMLQRAARELWLDLSRSFMAGDMDSDVLAGRHAGCRFSFLVGGRSSQLAPAPDWSRVPSLDHIADLVARNAW
jgi:D-glycero-D-manno-heptose 1,7-bisphosphate phosphatase